MRSALPLGSRTRISPERKHGRSLGRPDARLQSRPRAYFGWRMVQSGNMPVPRRVWPPSDGRSNTLLRPGCFGGQPLPDRPSLVIRKTPVLRPYHGLIRYEKASILPTHPSGTTCNCFGFRKVGEFKRFRLLNAERFGTIRSAGPAKVTAAD